MLWDTTIASNVGYIAAILYNQVYSYKVITADGDREIKELASNYIILIFSYLQPKPLIF